MPGDGPAVFVIFLLGAIVVGIAAWIELEFSPPIWVHIVVLDPRSLSAARSACCGR